MRPPLQGDYIPFAPPNRPPMATIRSGQQPQEECRLQGVHRMYRLLVARHRCVRCRRRIVTRPAAGAHPTASLHSMRMALAFGLLPFGRMTSRTPFFCVARIPAWSTFVGCPKERTKVPWDVPPGCMSLGRRLPGKPSPPPDHDVSASTLISMSSDPHPEIGAEHESSRVLEISTGGVH